MAGVEPVPHVDSIPPGQGGGNYVGYNGGMAELSLEVHALAEYIRATGIAHRVTATLGRKLSPSNPCDPHSPGSYHCKPGTGGPGLAIDLAGPSPGAVAAELLPIFDAFQPVEHLLAELIYSGADHSIKDGKRVPRYAIDAHFNHVHVSVPKGTVLLPQGGVVDMTKLIAAFPYQDGYVLVAEDGAVYCFGCEYKGGLKWDGSKWILR